MNVTNFFAELKRRNVYKVAVAYAVVSWLLIQAASILFPTFEAPAWVMKVFVAVLALGFPIALVLSWAFEITPEGIRRGSEIDPSKSVTPRTGRRIVGLTVVLAVVAAALLAFQLLRSKILTTTTSSVASIASTISAKSVAVLPLVNTSGDPSNEYFSDGLSEELIAVLAKIPDLKVIGRSSSFLFKGKSADSGAIGQKLGVAHLIEGSVRKQGDRVRIVAELVNAADGRSIWSETYDRELKDVFAVQEEIAKSVAQQMKVKLLGEKISQMQARRIKIRPRITPSCSLTFTSSSRRPRAFKRPSASPRKRSAWIPIMPLPMRNYLRHGGNSVQVSPPPIPRKRTRKPAKPRTKLLLSRPTWSKCERRLAGYR